MTMKLMYLTTLSNIYLKAIYVKFRDISLFTLNLRVIKQNFLILGVFFQLRLKHICIVKSARTIGFNELEIKFKNMYQKKVCFILLYASKNK